MVTLVLAGTLFCSCLSSDQKKDVARAQVAAAKENLNQVKRNAAVIEQNAATEDELKKFRLESELRIKINEASITKLKMEMTNSTLEQNEVYARKVDSFELKNINMRTRLNNYERAHTDWAKFKRDFNRDLDELADKLKNLAVTKK